MISDRILQNLTSNPPYVQSTQASTEPHGETELVFRIVLDLTRLIQAHSPAFGLVCSAPIHSSWRRPVLAVQYWASQASSEVPSWRSFGWNKM